MFSIYGLLIEKLKCVHLGGPSALWSEPGVSAGRPGCQVRSVYLLFAHKHLLTQMGHRVHLSVAQRGKCDRVFFEDLEKSSLFDSEEDFFFPALGPTSRVHVNRFVL